MIRQRNRSKLKEQEKSPGKEQLNGGKQITRYRLQNNGYKAAPRLGENINKIKTIRKNQLEMRNTLTEIKNEIQGTSSRVDEAEDDISDLKDIKAKHTQSEQKKEK